MVTLDIDIAQGMLHIRPRGLHRIWTLKTHIKVPLTQIVSVRRPSASDLQNWRPGLRLPGTYIPWLITAGSYLKNKVWSFWDVTNSEQTIEIELKGHRYKYLVIDVSDPAEQIEQIQAILDERAPN